MPAASMQTTDRTRFIRPQNEGAASVRRRRGPASSVWEHERQDKIIQLTKPDTQPSPWLGAILLSGVRSRGFSIMSA